MSQEEREYRTHIHLISLQFHLLVCDKPCKMQCPRCKAALLAQEALVHGGQAV